MENVNEKIPGRTRKNNSIIKARINCLMAWRDEHKIVCKEPKKDDEKKTSLQYETDILTKPYKNKIKK